MIHGAEERAAHHATAVTEAQAEERHNIWRAGAERAQQDEARKLTSRLEAALRQKGAMHEQPCPGCASRDLVIARLEDKNDVLERQLRERNAGYHKLEAECAEQTSRLAYDLDKARQAMATAHAAKVGTDGERRRSSKE